ncbi:MAG: outer membrane beta-barrel protein [Deltaproteobacteria bacterium]|nr:outer membrane beta-barrel protein [Deltaproteobacteria bacterium]
MTFRAYIAVGLLAFVHLCNPVFAEPGGGRGGKLKLPIYGGFTFSHNRGINKVDVSGHTGIAFGLGLDYKLMANPNLWLGIDALYISKGYESRDANGNVTRYELSYTEFPIQLKYAPCPQVILHGGFFLASFMVAATRSGEGNSIEVKSGFNNDYGVTFGVWVGFYPNKNLSVGLDLRYDMGFADIEKDNQPADGVMSRALVPLANVNFHF